MTDQTGPHIRDAAPGDVPAITAIYNHAVVNTVAVWNDGTVDEADRRVWLDNHQVPGTCATVAVDGDTVLGYATYGEFRHYDGFRHTVENSV